MGLQIQICRAGISVQGTNMCTRRPSKAHELLSYADSHRNNWAEYPPFWLQGTQGYVTTVSLQGGAKDARTSDCWRVALATVLVMDVGALNHCSSHTMNLPPTWPKDTFYRSALITCHHFERRGCSDKSRIQSFVGFNFCLCYRVYFRQSQVSAVESRVAWSRAAELREGLQRQVSACLTVESLNSSSLVCAAVMSAGTLLFTMSRSHAFDNSIMPSSDGHRDSCTYRL